MLQHICSTSKNIWFWFPDCMKHHINWHKTVLFACLKEIADIHKLDYVCRSIHDNTTVPLLVHINVLVRRQQIALHKCFSYRRFVNGKLVLWKKIKECMFLTNINRVAIIDTVKWGDFSKRLRPPSTIFIYTV